MACRFASSLQSRRRKPGRFCMKKQHNGTENRSVMLQNDHANQTKATAKRMTTS